MKLPRIIARIKAGRSMFVTDKIINKSGGVFGKVIEKGRQVDR